MSTDDGVADLCRSAFEQTNALALARSSDRPLRLLHFTGATGLRGMLGDRKIRLGRARTSNDSLEIKHGINVALKVIEERLRRPPSDYEKFFLQETERLVGSGEELLDLGLPVSDAHVACFCDATNGDSLLHWAMYGRQGNGYAIELDPSKFPDSSLYKIEYDHRAQVEIVTDTLDRFQAIARDCVPKVSVAKDRIPTCRYVGALCGFAISQVAACMKAEHFRPEDEWRLIETTSSVGAGVLAVQFGVSDPLITSFFETAIPPEAVTGVIVGSRVRYDLVKPTLRLLLQTSGFGLVPIRQTSVSLQ